MTVQFSQHVVASLYIVMNPSRELQRSLDTFHCKDMFSNSFSTSILHQMVKI